MNALRTLLTIFDVDTGQASTKLDALDKQVIGVKSTLAQVGKSLLGAFSLHLIKDFVEQQIELGSKLNDTAEKLGVGTDELQKFQFAAGLSGVEADSAAQALGFLNKNVGEALDGNKELAQTFQKLGVSLKDNQGVRELGDLLPEIADGFEKMESGPERTATAMKLFGRAGAQLIPLLKDGSGGLAEMYKRFDDLGLLIDEDFIKKADKAGDEIDVLKTAFRTLKTRIAIEVLPGITDLAIKFQNWTAWTIKLTKETNIVKEAWLIAGAVGSVAAIKTFAGWAKVFGLFNGKKGILENALGLGKFGLIIAAVAALVLAFEDLYTWVNGGQSVIGEFITETFGIEYATKLADQLRGAFESIEGAVGSVKEPLGEVFKLLVDISLQALPVVLGLFVDIVKFIAASIEETSAFVNAIGKLAKLDFKGAGKEIQKGDQKVFGEGGIYGDGFQSATLAAFQTQNSGPVRQPTDFQRGEQTIDLDQKIEININGAQDPNATGKAVASNLRGTTANGLQAAAAAGFRGAGDDE